MMGIAVIAIRKSFLPYIVMSLSFMTLYLCYNYIVITTYFFLFFFFNEYNTYIQNKVVNVKVRELIKKNKRNPVFHIK